MSAASARRIGGKLFRDVRYVDGGDLSDTPTKWLLFADMVSLFWELGRYRDWKGAILNIYRPSALGRRTAAVPPSATRRSSSASRGRRPRNGARTLRNARFWTRPPAEHAGVGMMTVHQFERDGSPPRYPGRRSARL
jgi:hypothetical protein